MQLIGQEGAEFNSEKILKWELYSVAAEEMMLHSDEEDKTLQSR